MDRMGKEKPLADAIDEWWRFNKKEYRMPVVKQQTPQPAARPASNGQPAASGNRSAWDLVDAIHMTLYGESGSGKTTFWATFPGPIRAAICSGSSLPGELRSINTPEYRKKIQAEIIDTVDGYCDWLEGLKDCETAVLDHASGLLGLVMKEYLKLDDIPAVKKWGMADQRDWGNINDKCIALLRPLLNFPGHVVIVAQERIFKGKEDGVTSEIIKPVVGAALTPGVAGWLYPACDFTVETLKRTRTVKKTHTVGSKSVAIEEKTREPEYCLRCEGLETFMTKFRKPKGYPLPEFIVDPNYDKILAVIQGKKP